MGIAVKMRAKTSLYDQPFPIYCLFLIFSHFQPIFFLHKLAILGLIFDSAPFNIWKYNRNVGITVNMRAKPSLYDQPFPIYWIFLIFSHFQPYFCKNWLFKAWYSTLLLSIFENAVEMQALWLKLGLYHLHTTNSSWYTAFFSYLAIFSHIFCKNWLF